MKKRNFTEPDISVVVASVNGWEYLSECVAAFERQQGEVTLEIIVADAVGPALVEQVRSKYPQVRLLAFDRNRSVPQLRAAGIGAARGGIVAMTEDHCIPAPDWCESVLRSHAANAAAAIGGPVDNAATSRLVDWAVYFCEYSSHASPVPRSVVHDLPGPNVSYKRRVLLDLDELITEEYWETFVHAALEARGFRLWSEPSVRVFHKMHFRFVSFLAERYHYGRAFAGKRNGILGPAQRILYFALSPLLPGLFLLRISRRVFSRKRNLGWFLLSVPLIVPFLMAGAAGECIGYAAGPGKSALWLR